MADKAYYEAPTFIRSFLGYLDITLGKSPATVKEYFSDLRTFFRYIKILRGIESPDTPLTQISISDVSMDLVRSITLTDVYEFFRYLNIERDNHANARARKVSSLRSFFSYMTAKAPSSYRLETNPVAELEAPRLKKSLPKYLTLEESAELLKSVDGPNKLRDFCILTLFLNCGLRLSELVSLNLQGIRDDNTMRVTGKGNKERIVYLNQACKDAIDNYLTRERGKSSKNITDKEALFLSARGQRISPKTVQHMVYTYLDKIGLDGQGYSVHKLRHTAATLMYQYGKVDILSIKEILGHENLAATQIYTHVANEQLRQAVESNPLASLSTNAVSASRPKSGDPIDDRIGANNDDGDEQQQHNNK